MPNTKLPKKASESALIQLNGFPGRRWAFEHRRLSDVVSDLNGWVMVLLGKIREIKREPKMHRRVSVALEPPEMDLMDKLLALVVVDGILGAHVGATLGPSMHCYPDGVPSIFDAVMRDDFDIGAYRRCGSADGAYRRCGSADSV